jgi:translation elongation factor EF-4
VYFLIRVFNGKIQPGDKVLISKMQQSKQIEVREVGIMNLKDPAQSAKNLGSTIVSEEIPKSENAEISSEKDKFNLLKPIPEMIEPK